MKQKKENPFEDGDDAKFVPAKKHKKSAATGKAKHKKKHGKKRHAKKAVAK